MALKKFRPVTAGSRFRSVSEFEEITRSTPEKSLTEGLSRKSGRNHHGRLTSRRRGGGHKRLYRKIDFRREKHGVPKPISVVALHMSRLDSEAWRGVTSVLGRARR